MTNSPYGALRLTFSHCLALFVCSAQFFGTPCLKSLKYNLHCIRFRNGGHILHLVLCFFRDIRTVTLVSFTASFGSILGYPAPSLPSLPGGFTKSGNLIAATPKALA